MAGQAKEMLDKIIYEHAKGDKILEHAMHVKLILKGIPVDKLTDSTPDDPAIIAKIKALAL